MRRFCPWNWILTIHPQDATESHLSKTWGKIWSKLSICSGKNLMMLKVIICPLSSLDIFWMFHHKWYRNVRSEITSGKQIEVAYLNKHWYLLINLHISPRCQIWDSFRKANWTGTSHIYLTKKSECKPFSFFQTAKVRFCRCHLSSNGNACFPWHVTFSQTIFRFASIW